MALAAQCRQNSPASTRRKMRPPKRVVRFADECGMDLFVIPPPPLAYVAVPVGAHGGTEEMDLKKARAGEYEMRGDGSTLLAFGRCGWYFIAVLSVIALAGLVLIVYGIVVFGST